MNEEIMTTKEQQTGGEANAQNASTDEVQLQPPAQDDGVPAGEAGGGPAAASGTKEPGAGEGAAPAAEAGEAQAQGDAPLAGADEPAQAQGNAGDAGHESAEARASAATARLADALLQAAIQKAGIPESRAKHAARLMDVSGVDPMADDAAQKYEAAVRQLLAEIPELSPATTGAAGEHPRQTADTQNETAAAFRRGMGR